jgi:ABC-type antimicrobial peptide transport system permease subunit
VVATGFTEGKRGGALGILIGLLIALPVGLGVFWTTRKMIKRTATRCGLYDAQLPPARMALAWGLVLGAIAWALIASFAVIWLTRLVVHHL